MLPLCSAPQRARPNLPALCSAREFPARPQPLQKSRPRKTPFCPSPAAPCHPPFRPGCCQWVHILMFSGRATCRRSPRRFSGRRWVPWGSAGNPRHLRNCEAALDSCVRRLTMSTKNCSPLESHSSVVQTQAQLAQPATAAAALYALALSAADVGHRRHAQGSLPETENHPTRSCHVEPRNCI